SNEPFLGDKSASVSIIEFGDYKCPGCKNFNESVVPEIQKDLIDTGKVKLYFMNYSFINVDSKRAAQFAESVYQELGNDTFWKFHNLLYKNLNPNDEKVDVLTKKYLTDTLKGIASQEDVDKVVKNFDTKKSYAFWKKDMNYAEKLGVSGTPTLLVNGKLFSGQSLDELKNMIDNVSKGE
ncbi:DsbA family protein, partial [Peribacillus butanolivorans]|uniref:DsbA family protein n=1 Tax=Peribacillus butanolivorans TaxID=421767 RepID=UPI0035D712DE